jgi:hypothetical protein
LSNFQTSIDIANRALQHCGARRIVAFTDDSTEAAAVSFCYDKLREAEMRRNVWRFSIRKVALRPIDTTWSYIAPLAYVAATAYVTGSVVSYLGQFYEATSPGSTGETPGLDASHWEVYCGPRAIRPFALNTGGTASDVSYFSGELALSGGLVYRSLVSSNNDIPPTAKWLSLGAASVPLSILYPVGSGPASQNDTRNIFMLPASFMREAPQDPKGGNISNLGAPSNNTVNDWLFQDDLLISSGSDVIVFRFAAGLTRVPKFDPMFCEGLAARIGLEICEEVTQSAEKLQTIGAAYNRFMGEARTVNGIEEGPVESPEDDWIVCRT